MDFSFFIAKRLALSKKSSISSAIIRIAIVAIGISVAAMIIAVFMIRGFQVNISEKIFGFWGHIDIIGSESSRDISLSPLNDTERYISEIKSIDTIRFIDENEVENAIKVKIDHIQQYIIFPAIMSTKDAFEGLLMKGVGEDFDDANIKKYLKSGYVPDFSSDKSLNEVLISKYTADRLKLESGKNVILNFITDNDQVRKKVKIAGIYSTGLMEYDKKLVLMNISMLRQILGWEPHQAGGIEVFVNDLSQLDIINDYIYVEILPKDIYSMTARQKFPAIFEWLKLQNINEQVILILMLIVSVINMVTSLLILILEQTKMIGILRALGSDTWSVRKIFLYHAGFIVLFGLILGDIIGLGVSFLQKEFGLIKLDEASYYLSEAPVFIDIPALIAINVATLIITVLILIIPSYLVSKIDPVRTISFR
ncbi:MAG: ABC transporter permease [Saprospiraceae bacterium]|nr:ABC transporter permease [Saprospiraceae bacterium]